jgi:hypothetical protein
MYVSARLNVCWVGCSKIKFDACSVYPPHKIVPVFLCIYFSENRFAGSSKPLHGEKQEAI